MKIRRKKRRAGCWSELNAGRLHLCGCGQEDEVSHSRHQKAITATGDALWKGLQQSDGQQRIDQPNGSRSSFAPQGRGEANRRTVSQKETVRRKRKKGAHSARVRQGAAKLLVVALGSRHLWRGDVGANTLMPFVEHSKTSWKKNRFPFPFSIFIAEWHGAATGILGTRQLRSSGP